MKCFEAKLSSIVSLGATLLLVGTSAIAVAETTTQPNNSAKNDATVSGTDMSAQDQGSGKADIDLTQKIRRSLTSDSSLSTSAQNVKIISNNGYVVLRGTVNSPSEKRIIENRATTMLTSASKLTSYLEVNTKSK